MSLLRANYDFMTEKMYENLFIDDTPFYVENFVYNPECLATWKDVEICCNQPWQPGYLMDPNKGKVIPDGHEWACHGKTKERFDMLYNQGGVCFLDYGEHNEETNELMGFFEDKFNVNARGFLQAHLEPMTGYGLHCDARETMGIFIVQIEGRTDWKIYNNRLSSLVNVDHPVHMAFNSKRESGETQKLFDERLKLVIDVRMNPGDLIYIPHRMYHHATPFERRLSLSIPCFAREQGDKPEIDRRYYRIDKSLI